MTRFNPEFEGYDVDRFREAYDAYDPRDEDVPDPDVFFERAERRCHYPICDCEGHPANCPLGGNSA